MIVVHVLITLFHQFHQLCCQTLDLAEEKLIIMDLHQFHTNSCMSLPDGIHLVHGFNGIGRAFARHILDFYPEYGYIESAGCGLFYAALWTLLCFGLFMALAYFNNVFRKSGTTKDPDGLSYISDQYIKLNKRLEIGDILVWDVAYYYLYYLYNQENSRNFMVIKRGFQKIILDYTLGIMVNIGSNIIYQMIQVQFIEINFRIII